jgi:DNA-binding CsgD family transcriptional regulator
MGAVAAVFVSSGHAPSAIREIAATLYGLSRSEAAVFEHIAMGDTIAQAARALGVGASTVRTHLRIYAKTGVHRQAELVRLASGLRSPLA